METLSVATGTPTGITASTATLTGTVSPGAAQADFQFEYGTTANYGSKTSSSSVAGASTPQSVTCQISGLTAGTTYHVQLLASNAAVQVHGADVTFTTLAAARPVFRA